MSSVCGLSRMLGLGQMGQIFHTPFARAKCVINLPSEDLVSHVVRLALTTGKNPVPEKKLQWGYCYEPDKFGIAVFTPVASESVAPPRVGEAPDTNGGRRPRLPPLSAERERHAFEVHILNLHVDEGRCWFTAGATGESARWSR